MVDIVDFNSYYPLGGNTDVIIDSPAETNFIGVAVGNGSSLNIGSARLVILKPGQWWGGTTAGVFITDGEH